MNVDCLAALTLAVGCGCLMTFLWATKRHFVVSGPMPAGMRAVILLSFLGSAWFVVRVVIAGAGPGAPYAIILMVVSLGLFCWTVKATRARRLPIAFADDLPDFICRSGPYRFVRHPFYLSYILCWLGTSAATSDVWSWVVPVVMSVFYVVIARREERRFTTSRLAGLYDAYQKSTAMFIPMPFKWGAGEERG